MSVSVISGRPPMCGRPAGNHSPATKDVLHCDCEGVIREAPAVEEAWDGKTSSPTDLDLANLLADLLAGGENPKPPLFITCKVNVYSADPENLVGGRRPAPGIGHGKEASYYFFCLPAPGTERKRNRNVGGGAASERRMWHPETLKQIRSADGKSVVAYKRALSYKISCPPGQETPTSSGMLSTGWIMIEISLKKKAHDGAAAAAAAQEVLCVIYKSKRSYPEALAGAGTPPIELGRHVPEVEDEQLCSAGGDMPTPAPVAADKAVSCDDFKNACEMKTCVDLKELILNNIDMLRSMFSDSFHKLEVRLQHVTSDRELTPIERDPIFSCGEDMSATISSYFNDFGKRTQQDFHALESYVHHQVSQRASRVMKVPLVIVHDTATKRGEQVHDSACLEDGFVSKLEGAENEFLPVPENSSAGASCSGVKRKADHDHPKAPTGVRQQRVAEAGGDNGGQPEGCCARLQEGVDNFDDDVAVRGGDQAMPQSLFSEKDPMLVGDGNGGDLGAGVSEVQHEHHGVAQVAEGTALDVDFLFSEDLKDSGGDNGGCPDYWNWTGIGDENLESTGVLLVGGGEQAMPDCADETEHQLLPQDNDLAAGGGDNVGDPSEIFRGILNDKVQIEPITDDGRDLAARLCTGTILDGDDYPGLFNVDKYTETPIDVGFFAEPDLQQVFTDGGSALDVLLHVSPDELLGPSFLL